MGEGITEMRIDYGPDYRVYFTKRGSELIILLTGLLPGIQLRYWGPPPIIKLLLDKEIIILLRNHFSPLNRITNGWHADP